MAGREQLHVVAIDGLRSDRVELARETGAGHPEVECRQGGERVVEGIGLGIDETRKLVEDPLLLRLDGQLCLAPDVAQLDDDQRLDEQRLAAARLVMDDALHLAALVGADRDHVATVAQRDERFLKDTRHLAAVHQLLEPRPKALVSQADGA